MADEQVTVRINGEESSLADAVSKAASDLRRLTSELQYTQQASEVFGQTGAASNVAWLQSAGSADEYSGRLQYLQAQLGYVNQVQTGTTGGLDDATSAFQRLTQETNYAQAATQIFGQEGTQSMLSWLHASSSTDEYTQRLSYLQAQLGYVSAAQGDTKGTTEDLDLSWGGLTNSLMGSIGQFGSFLLMANAGVGLIQQLGSVLMTPVDMLAQLGQNLLSLAENAGWDAIQTGIGYLQQMTEQMFELNQQTEKNVYGWQFEFGGGAGGKAQAAQLAQWTSHESMNVPFTRQDLMGAVSTLGAKFSAQDIEKYVPTIADYASTLGATAYGGQGITLQQAARAITELEMGRSQMFKMEFNVDPGQLVKYGLDASVNKAGAVHIKDMSTLLPALQNYARARGISGAAKGTAQNTFWGEWSSFQDRIQNFLLQSGGMNLDGSVQGGSFFGGLKDDLNGISSWIDQHQSQIQHIATLIGNVFGGAVHDATITVEGLAEGLHASGLDTLLEGLVSSLGQDLANPATQQFLEGMATTLGKLAGTLASGGIQSGEKVLQGLFSGLDKSDVISQITSAFQGLGQWLSDPKNQQELGTFADMFGQIAGTGIGDAVTVIKQMGDAIDRLMKSMTPQEEGDIVTFLKVSFLGFQNLGTIIVDLIPIFGDFGRVVSDILHQNWGDLGAAMAQTKLDGDKMLTDLLTNTKNTMDSIANQSFTWGSDFSENFAQGMYSKQADVQRAANEQAKLVAQYLHHTTPDIGPLAGDDKWGLEFVSQIAGGMVQGMPQLASATRQVAQTIAGPLTGNGATGVGGSGGSAVGSSVSTSYGDSIANVNIHGATDGRIETVAKRLLAARDSAGNLAMRRPGNYGQFGWIG